MPHLEFINPTQAEDNIATLKIDDQIYSLEQVMANTSLAISAVGDFYPATPFNSTSLRVDLTKNPRQLAKDIFVEDLLEEIIYTNSDKFIVLDGLFTADKLLNVTFNSQFGVILSNAKFIDFEVVNIISTSGIVYIHNSTASNFIINSKFVLLSGELTTLSLTINSNNFLQKGSISASTLTITHSNNSDEITILGKILTQNDINFFLAQSTIHIDSQASIESMQGFIKIYDVTEFTNNIFLKGKAGIEIRAAEKVKNNKIIATHGLLSITTKSFESHANIEAGALHIEITSPILDSPGVEISGEVKTQHNATIILNGSKIILRAESTINVEGFLMIKDAYEFVNNIHLWAKQGIYINTGALGIGVTNNKEIITPGTLEIWSKSFDNHNYIEATDLSKFGLTHSFNNHASGMLKLGGLLVQNPWHPISQFTNLGTIKVGTLGVTIDAKIANFLAVTSGEVERSHVKYIDGRCSCISWTYVNCNIYEERLKTYPISSFFQSDSNIVFNVGTLTQGYGKIYSSGKILFHHTTINQQYLSLKRDGFCDVLPVRGLNDNCERHSADSILFTHVGQHASFQETGRFPRDFFMGVSPFVTGVAKAENIYRSLNPIMHAVGGFTGTLSGLKFSSSGFNIPQLEYNAAITSVPQVNNHALTLYQPSQASELVSLQGLYIARNSSNEIIDITYEGRSILGGFFPSAFVWESIVSQISYGHFRSNADNSGALVVWGHPIFDHSLSAYGLVPAGTDPSIRMLGDHLFYDHLFKEAIFKLFSSIKGINNNDLFALLAEECNKTRAKFNIAYGKAPTVLQVNIAYSPMACPIKTTQCYGQAAICYDYKIFYSNDSLYNFVNDAGVVLYTEQDINLKIDGNVLIDYMTKIKAGQRINLNVDGDVLVLGQIESTGDLEIKANSIAMAGRFVVNNGDAKFSAIYDIVNVGAIEVNGDLHLNAGHDIIELILINPVNPILELTKRTIYAIDGDLYYQAQHDITQQASVIFASGDVVMNAGNNIMIESVHQSRVVKKEHSKKHYLIQSTIDQYDAVIMVNGKIEMTAGNNFIGSGVKLAASTGDVSIKAGEKATLEDKTSYAWNHRGATKKKLLGKSKVSVSWTTYETAQVEITAPGGTVYVSSKDCSLEGGRIDGKVPMFRCDKLQIKAHEVTSQVEMSSSKLDLWLLVYH